MTTNYSYDNLSRLLSVLHQVGTSTIDGNVYTYDSVGNGTAKTNELSAVTSSYTYDPLNELTQVTQATNTTESYSFDPVGNRLTSLGVSPYSSNTSNELTSTPTASYSYDYNGNLTSKTISGNTTQYNWDFENRLISAVLPGTGSTVTFKYDGLGRRVQKAFTQNSTTTTICQTKAIEGAVAGVALDAVGLVPGGEAAEAALSDGESLFKGFELGANLGAIGLTVSEGNGLGAGLVLTETTITILEVAKGVGGVLPVAGQVVAGVSILWDIYRGYQEYKDCTSGGQ
ncbi:MAG: hypothetical protein WCD49_01715 [Candidatus Acidiferrales bacterium]